ncbi:MAG TPA: hypothetical protein VL201_03730 [Patescibacteria group bacterium]|jgi:hypothetical protein|nr:hypothetical protein [Patescibacteria group bacterium]
MKRIPTVNHAEKPSWLSFLQEDPSYSRFFSTVLLYEEEYPLSFISYYIKHHNKGKLIAIDLADTQTNIATLFEHTLEITFLGQKCTYLIKTPWEELSHVQQNILLRMIHTYAGPHSCIIPVQKTATSAFQSKNIHLVQTPTFLSFEEALLLARQLPLNCMPIFQKIVKLAIQQSENIPFHLVTTLFDYSSVVSNTLIDDFSTQMLPSLLKTKQSLYELSGQLFGKKQSFFQTWYVTEPTYSQAFWTTFWCDQLMKAALFCTYKKRGATQEAHIIGTGLPFSFLNKDWRLYTAEGLSKGYTALYEYDCRVKERILIKSLDSFFIKFFRHEFD